MVVPCHHWPDMLQFLGSPVTDVTLKVIGQGCAVLWAGGCSSLGSGIHFRLAEETRLSEADMESQGFLMRGQFFSSVVYGVARYKTQPRRAQHQQQDTEVGDTYFDFLNLKARLRATGDG
ncbi:hypothetical protein CSKR_110292 [Clonorchis sinensis]|uniref:Uncharacterized protein n=1 Tax=Clonorchis sinensis TaxID=79923 RepID=A0A3R7EYK2_CLOSI|nr:hypothetical protein CSKR_110292 [Clonorchis sinensis]